MSSPGAFPLRKGDRVVLRVGEQKQEGRVTHRQKHVVKAEGDYGRLTLSIVGDGDDVSMTIGVRQTDADGRELFLED